MIKDDGFCSTENITIWFNEIVSSIEIFDYLNVHCFDYRGLIPMGLAIEVTKKTILIKNMTQEDKHIILLVDLCSRSPYGPICEDIYGNLGTLLDLAPELNSVTLKISELGSTWTTDIDKVKPYLRPMSSMTEEEKETYESFIISIAKDETGVWELIDWLNERYLDYRGLIEKGLAEIAPKGMYQYN